MGSFGAPFDTGDAVTKHRLGRKTIHQMTGGEIDALIIDDNLVSQYVFAGNANDSVGSNNLTENGTPTYDADGGPDGQYIILNGSSQYLTASANTVHDITTGDFSFTFWIYRTSDSGSTEHIVKKQNSTTNAGYRIIITSSDTIGGRINAGSDIPFNSTSTIAINTWYFVAVVFDRDGNGTIYINGTADGTPVDISGQSGSITNTQTFTVGRDSSASSGFFPGRIDDLRIYSKALSADEVKAIMNDCRGGMTVRCSETGSGFVKDNVYQRNIEGTDWDQIYPVATDIQVFPHSTTIGDYSTPEFVRGGAFLLEDFASYATQALADASWVPADTAKMRANITNANLDFNAVADNSNDAIYKDLGVAVPDTAFILRFKIKFSAKTIQGLLWVGLASTNGAQNTNQDSIGVHFLYDTSTKAYFSVDSDGAAIPMAGSGDNSASFDPATDGTEYYFEIERSSSTAYTVRRYTDSTYSSVADSAAGTCAATVTGLQYVKVCNRVASIAGSLVGTIDNIQVFLSAAANAFDDNTGTTWTSTSMIGPNAVSKVSSGEAAAIAIYLHSDTTATQIKIQTSPDGFTWADARKINKSAMATGEWNYIRFNRATSQARYVRILGLDATAKVLAISEIKLLAPTESVWGRRHGHQKISTSDTGLPLSG